MIFHQSITRIRAPRIVNPWGDEVWDWDAAERTEIHGVHVQPLSQLEDDTGTRDLVVTGWRLYSAPGVDLDLRATDRVELDGIVCEVDGEVARWPDPFTVGRVDHVEATLRRAEG